MRECKIYANIWPAETLCRLLASAGLLLVVSAGTARAQVKDLADWVPVSINAGETYVINDIKPGTKPSFKVEQNPNAFVSYDSPPGKLTMLSAAAGRWIVTVTNTSDRDVSYDVNAFAVAKPGAPLTPGKAPRSLSDEGLDSRPGAGASTSTPSATPELATISSSSTPSSPVPYSVTLPAKTPSYNDATWSVPPQPGSGVQAYEPGQSVGPLESRAGQYRNDPSGLPKLMGALQGVLKSRAPMIAASMKTMDPAIRARMEQAFKAAGVDVDALARGEGTDTLAKLMAERGRVLAAAAGLSNQPPASGAGAQASGKGASISLDKAWHGVHYLLCGKVQPGTDIASQAVMGGTEVGEDLGYGPARYFEADKVAEIARELTRPNLETEMTTRFDPPQMAKLGIYPGQFEPDDSKWLMDAFRQLRQFYVDASAANLAVMTCIE